MLSPQAPIRLLIMTVVQEQGIVRATSAAEALGAPMPLPAPKPVMAGVATSFALPADRFEEI